MTRLEGFVEEEILAESILDRGIFKAVFMGGAAGSGKSYVAKKIKSGSIEPRIVNVDTHIEKFGAGSKGDEQWADVYDTFWDKSKHLTMSQLLLYINSCLPLFIDSTSTEPSNLVRRYNVLENIGYDMAFCFVDTSLETALQRNKDRQRTIPDELVKDYHDKSQKTKSFLRSKFPLFMEVKNDKGELNDEVVLNVFKKMLFFYDSPVQNPIGQDVIQKMRDNGYKYLTPELYSMSELKGMISSWYRSH